MVQKRNVNILSKDKNRFYEKRQNSRFKRFVATMSDGTKIQSDTQPELNELMSEHKRKISDKELLLKGPIKGETKKPQFDPYTGEPL